MAELNAVAGDSFTPISWGVVVNGRLIDVSAVYSATATIDGATFALISDTVTNRLTGNLPIYLSEFPGVYTGYLTLITNTGTYRVPDAPNYLTMEVLEGLAPGLSTFSNLLSELSAFLQAESGAYLITES